MWRAFFLAIGTMTIILGLECLAVEKVLLRVREPPPAQTWLDVAPKPAPNKVLVPAPWIPWSFISAGAVVCLYSFTIPKRMGGG